MNCGDSFLMPAPGLGNTHLWIVITEPDPECIIVNLTTLRSSRDQTVILQPGDHPFVRHPTAVLYSDARIVRAPALASQVQAGTISMNQHCPASALALIQSGILAPPFTPKKVQRFWRERKAIL